MRYSINAWLEHGEPRVGIVNTESGAIKVQWRLVRIDTPDHHNDLQHQTIKPVSNIQQLTRQLFLLCCAEDIAMIQKSTATNSWDQCLRCDQCAVTSTEHDTISHTNREFGHTGAIIPFGRNPS